MLWKSSFITKVVVSCLAPILVNSAALASGQEPVRNVAEYNLTAEGVGLKGYDPVSYFPEGGGMALPGSVATSYNHAGAIYHFASQANLDLFVSNPKKYEPTYGGWCAYAMAFGEKIDIDPTLFTVNGSRAHFFVSTAAKRDFDANVPAFERRADIKWKSLSGEEPRR